jgi:hypothetical protein
MPKHKFQKIIIILLLGVFLSSCGSSQYRSYKRYVKRKYSAMGYRSQYQRKLKSYTMPINKNYMIRQKNTYPRWM